jgi:hypothetical protein
MVVIGKGGTVPVSPSVCGPLDAHRGRITDGPALETLFPQLLSPLIRDIIDFLTMSKVPDYGISEERNVLLVQVSGLFNAPLPIRTIRA